jgi:hypothetical protein
VICHREQDISYANRGLENVINLQRQNVRSLGVQSVAHFLNCHAVSIRHPTEVRIYFDIDLMNLSLDVQFHLRSPEPFLSWYSQNIDPQIKRVIGIRKYSVQKPYTNIPALFTVSESDQTKRGKICVSTKTKLLVYNRPDF